MLPFFSYHGVSLDHPDSATKYIEAVAPIKELAESMGISLAHCCSASRIKAVDAAQVSIIVDSQTQFESQQSQQREVGSQCETSTGKQRALAAIDDACVQSSGVHAHTRSREAAARKQSLLDELHAGQEMINQLRSDMSLVSAQHNLGDQHLLPRNMALSCLSRTLIGRVASSCPQVAKAIYSQGSAASLTTVAKVVCSKSRAGHMRMMSSTVQGGTTPSVEDMEAVVGPLSTAPMIPEPSPIMVVISGPSGVGKDSVVDRLKEKRADLYFVVTATSRAMRPKEVEGRDYFFVSREKFEGWMADDQLLEHALVYGEYKGIPASKC
eukprot:gene24738-10375_t